MAKKKKFKRIASRVLRLNKSFTTGYKRSVKANVSSSIITLSKLVKSKYTKTRFKAKKVNEYLMKLQRWGRYDTWASKTLIDNLSTGKINIITGEGLIDVNKINYNTFNQTGLSNIQKSIDKFLNSKTKTIQGINASVRKKRADLILKSDNPQWVKSLNNREIETLYKVFDDETFKNLSEKIKYEKVWDTIIESKAKKWSKEDFQNELLAYTNTINDKDISEELSIIYDKFIETK